MGELTRSAGGFVARLRYADLPPGAAQAAMTGMADCASVILLGLEQPVTSLVAKGAPLADEAVALWGKLRTTADYAALLNATSAHSLDYDDTSGDSHPSAVLFPAILAVGEPFASGKDILTAYVAGYEVWCDLASRDEGKHHAKGFHPTGIFGPVGAAAACSNLLRLNAEQASAALAIAASMSAGLVANFGTMTKPYQLGRAAQSGVLAAQMAAAGMTAGTDALEHPQGFLSAFSPAGQVDCETEPCFGETWRIVTEGINIKLYPVCYAAHRMIDSVTAMDSVLRNRANAIRSIRVYLGKSQSQILRYRTPSDALQAKFSAEFAVAAAILAGHVGLGELEDAYVNGVDVGRLMSCTERIESDEIDLDQSLFSPADWVEIEFTDGETRVGPPVRFAAGHARNPVADSKLWLKFEECTQSQLDESRRKTLFSRLNRLQDLERISELYDWTP
jgi:2-methylcitrate dehydratase PrpD